MPDGEARLSEEETQRILKRRAQLLARVAEEEADRADVMHVVAFRLGEERYGVEAALVREVQPHERSTSCRVPCTPDFIVGAVNVRGRTYSLMDVGRFLGLPPRAASEESHVLLVSGVGPDGETPMELGILADERPEALVLAREDLGAADAAISGPTQGYVLGVTEDSLVVLDLERLLSAPEIVVSDEQSETGAWLMPLRAHKSGM